MAELNDMEAELLIENLNHYGIEVATASEGHPAGRFGWHIEDGVLTAKLEEYTPPFVARAQWKLVPVG